MKRCTKCGIDKELSEFYKDSSRKDGHMSACKECDRSKNKKWAKANPEKAAKRSQKWAKANPEKRKEYSKKHYHQNKEYHKQKSEAYRKNNSEKIKNKVYLQKYNITLEQYNSMYAHQNGCCAICGKHQDSFSSALHVDHCHSTKEVRGLLCFQCNTAIGKFNDNISLLLKAVEYLTNPPYKDKD